MSSKKFVLPVEVYNCENSLSSPQVDGPRKLFIGGVHVAKNLAALRENNIEVIVNCTYSSKCFYQDEMQYIKVPLADDVHQELASAVPRAARLIQEKGNGKNVLVHCSLGVSRSVSIAIAWLMTYRNMGLFDSLKLIKASHPIAQPNIGFLQELCDYEAKLRGKNSCEMLRTCKACSKLILSDVKIVFPGCGHSMCKSCKSQNQKQRLCPHCVVESRFMKKSPVRPVPQLGNAENMVNPSDYLPFVR